MLGDNPIDHSLSAHLASRSTESFCSRLFLQKYLYGEQSWKIERVSSSQEMSPQAGCSVGNLRFPKSRMPIPTQCSCIYTYHMALLVPFSKKVGGGLRAPNMQVLMLLADLQIIKSFVSDQSLSCFPGLEMTR